MRDLSNKEVTSIHGGIVNVIEVHTNGFSAHLANMDKFKFGIIDQKCWGMGCNLGTIQIFVKNNTGGFSDISENYVGSPKHNFNVIMTPDENGVLFNVSW
ncbi:MAG: hypothetical protein JSS07_07240 [Proteobacteria bacterium]|nr:hypothetical protein [Pseudomonadota bacterium]